MNEDSLLSHSIYQYSLNEKHRDVHSCTFLVKLAVSFVLLNYEADYD
jgi:hypothetical protein